MKTRRNQEGIMALVQQWQKSGLSQAEFSRKHKLNNKTLNNWIKQFKENKTQINNSFVEIIPETAPKNSGQIFIRYPNGIEVELPETINFKEIKQLISQ